MTANHLILLKTLTLVFAVIVCLNYRRGRAGFHYRSGLEEFGQAKVNLETTTKQGLPATKDSCKVQKSDIGGGSLGTLM